MGFRTARIKAGKKVSEVMMALEVSDAAVYQWETGETKPRQDKLLKLARLYGCTIEELITPDDDSSVSENQSDKTDS